MTGSVGKTSTKEMLRAILAGQGKTHAAEASYNNHWGVPLTLARMPVDTDFAVIEIGMNHPGRDRPLTRMAKLDVAMITTVAAAHLEAFASVDDIAREKASIFAGLVPGGVAVFNADLETSPILRAVAETVGARKVGFGLGMPGPTGSCWTPASCTRRRSVARRGTASRCCTRSRPPVGISR